MMIYLLREQPREALIGLAIMLDGPVDLSPVVDVPSHPRREGQLSRRAMMISTRPQTCPRRAGRWLMLVMRSRSHARRRGRDATRANDTARFLAGLPARRESSLAPLTREPSWQQHARALRPGVGRPRAAASSRKHPRLVGGQHHRAAADRALHVQRARTSSTSTRSCPTGRPTCCARSSRSADPAPHGSVAPHDALRAGRACAPRSARC